MKCLTCIAHLVFMNINAFRPVIRAFRPVIRAFRPVIHEKKFKGCCYAPC